MIERTDVVAYGRAAAGALADHIAGVKADRPLAAVTVVVPSNFAGLAARRALGGGRFGTGGIANVRFVTPLRLATLLGADFSDGVPGLTNPVLGAAVRRALADEPGPFGEVADHHATEAAVSGLYGELSHVGDEALERTAATGGLAGDSVQLYRAVARRLGGFRNEDQLAERVAGRDDLEAATEFLGHIVWYLPAPLTLPQARLMAAVLAACPSSVVLALCGVDDADAAVLDTCRRVGVVVPSVDGIEPATASLVISVTDADEEVRAVVRRIAGLCDAGMALDRIGVFYPVADPYLRTLRQQLRAALIPCNGPSPQRLIDGVAGRALMAALGLPGERWRRDRVMSLVSGLPPRHGADAARSADWETLSRVAGVIGPLRDWEHKLASRSAALERRRAELFDAVGDDDDATVRRARRVDRERTDVERLAAFVARLAELVTAVETAPSWAMKARRANALLSFLVGEPSTRDAWPEFDIAAGEAVETALERLGELDDIEVGPSAAVFRRALHAELDVTRGREGRFGEGVLIGPLLGSIGHELDAVFILGMAEGQCPAPRRDDALLPDIARQAAGDGALAERSRRLYDQHRALLALLASAPVDQRYLLFPRGDLRGGRRRLPSRWLLDSVSERRGARVYSTKFAELGEPFVKVIDSHAAGLLSDEPVASLEDRDAAEVLQGFRHHRDPATHPVMAVAGVHDGIECMTARASASFTKWDGNLAGHAVPSPATTGEVLSATRLERWAGCGMHSMFSDVLGLRERDDPERITDLSPLDRGSAVHEILERFIRGALDDPPDPTSSWGEAGAIRMHAIAHEVFDELERRGRTGRAVHWRLLREETLAKLDEFLLVDDVYRARAGATPSAVEVPFGMRGGEPVEIELSRSRRVRFRGVIDRVDVTTSGRHEVIDYKTGNPNRYSDLAHDPTRSGRTLQLGLYSEAAVQLLGATRSMATYWMVDGVTADRPGYDWAADRRRRFVEVVTAIVDGIESGVFAAEPGEWDSWRRTHTNCRFCDFDDVCVRDRGDHAAAKAGAAELAVRDVLVAGSEVTT